MNTTDLLSVLDAHLPFAQNVTGGQRTHAHTLQARFPRRIG